MLDVLPDNIGIVFCEGFRTLSQQKAYFDSKFLEVLQMIPNGYEAYVETTKHVSPFIKNIPTHATGAAIDMRLFVQECGENVLLDLGKFDVIFGPNDQQETFSENTTLLQRYNRLMLLEAATKAGLANYGYEWWHYSYGDKMYAYVYGEPYAFYGLVTEEDHSILSMTVQDYIKQITQ